jgi:uncharacterized repeat protein (TIGR01451 family)
MRIRGFLLAALALALAAPAAASADTTLGITTQPAGSTANLCPAGPSPPANELLFEFAGTPPAGPLTVPTSSIPLALTHWAVDATGVTAPQQLTIVVMQLVLTGTPSLTVVGTDTETVTPPASPAADVEQFTLSQPLPVQSGDLIGQYAPATTPGLTCYWSGGPSETADVEGFPQSAPPTAGESIIPSAVGVESADSDLNLAATLAPLSYDAGLSLSAGPSNAIAGQPAILTATVTNHGPQGGPVTFTDPVPSGLTVDYAAASAGSCSTSTINIVTCSLTAIAAGQSTKVAIVVTPKSAQSYADSGAVSLTGGGNDPNPANDSATTTLTVGLPGPANCVVPKLGGASLALTKKLLPLLGCKVGKVKKATSKSVAKGDVISTSPGAGSYAVGKSIAITESAGKPKPKPKPKPKRKKKK